MAFALKSMINAELMIPILDHVLVAIEAMIFKLAKVMDLKQDNVFILLLTTLPSLMLDAKFGTGILIPVLNALNSGIS